MKLKRHQFKKRIRKPRKTCVNLLNPGLILQTLSSIKKIQLPINLILEDEIIKNKKKKNILKQNELQKN